MALTIQEMGLWVRSKTTTYLFPLLLTLSLGVSGYTCYHADSIADETDARLSLLENSTEAVQHSPTQETNNLPPRLVRLEGAVDLLASDTYQRAMFKRQMDLFEQEIKDRQQLQQPHGGE